MSHVHMYTCTLYIHCNTHHHIHVPRLNPLHHDYLIGSGDASLLVNDGLNDEDGQGLPPSVVKERVDRGEVRELEDGEGVLVRLDWHLHQADQLARHAGRAVDTVGGVCAVTGQVKVNSSKFKDFRYAKL